MIAIPAEIRIRYGLRQGAVYYFEDEDIAGGDPHYYIVVNGDPTQGDPIILVIATSQIEKNKNYVSKRSLPVETLVEVKEEEYVHFTKDTIFNCNNIRIKTIEELIEKLDQGVLKTFEAKISDEVLQKIIRGIISSPLVSRHHKKLIDFFENY